jgi:predicted exporter
VTRLRRVLPGLAIGLSTTLIGYCTFLLAPFPGLQQVATFSVIGLAVSCLTVMICYPLFDRHRPPQPRNRFVRVAAMHWSFWQSKSRLAVGLRWTLLGGCIVAAVVGLTRLQMDDDVHHFQSLSPDLKQQEAAFAKLTGTPAGTQFLLVRARDQQALLQKEEQLRIRLAKPLRDGAIGEVTAISQYVPSIARQKENRALINDRLFAPYLQGYLRDVGYAGVPDYPQPARFLMLDDLPPNGPFAMARLLDVSGGGQAAHVMLLNDVRNVAALKAALSAVTAAVVGVVLNLAVWFALHTLFAQVQPIRFGLFALGLPVWSSVDLAAVAISAAAMLATLRFKVGMIAVLAVSCMAGICFHLLNVV